MNKWTAEQDELLLSMLNKCDMEFKKAQKYFPHKTVNALQLRFRRIDPSVKSGKWLDDEDIKLIQWVFDDAILRAESSLALFGGRRKIDVENRVLHFKNVLLDRMFPGKKINLKSESVKVKNSSKKSKRVMKRDRKNSDEGACNSTNSSKNKNIKREKNSPINKLNELTESIKKEKVTFKDNSSKSLSSALKESMKSKEGVSEDPLDLQKFLISSNLSDKSDRVWTNCEVKKLFELHSALGTNWTSISKFFDGTTSQSVEEYFFNVLKYSAFVYSSDLDSDENELATRFPDVDKLSIDDPLTASQEQLLPLTAVALHLVSIGQSNSVKNCGSKVLQK